MNCFNLKQTAKRHHFHRQLILIDLSCIQFSRVKNVKWKKRKEVIFFLFKFILLAIFLRISTKYRVYFICFNSKILGLTEIINDIEKGNYLKSLTPISFSQSNEYLESALSPKSVESQTSCRSHDGVFLRPGEQQKKSLK